MNQWESMNRRADELERILNTGKVNYSSPKVPQQPTLYEIQQQNADDVRKLLEQYEADLKEQAKENEKNRELALKSYKVSVAAAIFGGASFVAAFITLILQLLG